MVQLQRVVARVAEIRWKAILCVLPATLDLSGRHRPVSRSGLLLGVAHT